MEKVYQVLGHGKDEVDQSVRKRSPPADLADVSDADAYMLALATYKALRVTVDTFAVTDGRAR